MCGRYILNKDPISGRESWPAVGKIERLQPPDLSHLGPLFARYNVAPTQQVAAVRQGEDGPVWDAMRWGLVSPWVHDRETLKKRPPLFNARAESLAEKNSFKGPLKTHRCLVPATGFIEWKVVGKDRQPYLFEVDGGQGFFFAGLWTRYRLGDEEGTSCTIITTTPNEVAGAVHDRMPVILPPEAYMRWLDPEEQDPAAVLPMLRPYPDGHMGSRPIDKRIGSPKVDEPSLLNSL